MNFLVNALLPIILAFPDVLMTLDKAKENLSVVVDGKDDLLDSCTKSGMNFSYNFETQICKERIIGIFSNCSEAHKEQHQLTYDSISGRYRLDADVLDDGVEPQVTYYSTLEDARKAHQMVRGISIQTLIENDDEYLNGRRSYIRTRVVSECHGDHNETLADISSFLTLGLYRVSGFDTGWVDFRFKDK